VSRIKITLKIRLFHLWSVQTSEASVSSGQVIIVNVTLPAGRRAALACLFGLRELLSELRDGQDNSTPLVLVSR